MKHLICKRIYCNWTFVGSFHNTIISLLLLECLKHDSINAVICFLECTIPYYGQNCTSVCQCGQGSNQCHHVTGCVCNDGWTGSDCDVDIDECSANPNTCPSGEVCVNFDGRYSCNCRSGYQRNGSFCIGMFVTTIILIFFFILRCLKNFL